MALPDVLVTDADLIARVRRGDEAALEVIYREHFEALCRYALRWLRSPALAEEVVQEVFLRVWWRRAQWEVGGTIAAYLFTAVRNGALNHLRGARTQRNWEERSRAERQFSLPQPSGEEADELVRTRELAQAIDAAVEGLAPRCRETFVLRRKHGLSYVEIAQIMGITPKTVEVQVGLALRALRQRLGDWL